jgi:hypothetical protein
MQLYKYTQKSPHLTGLTNTIKSELEIDHIRNSLLTDDRT